MEKEPIAKEPKPVYLTKDEIKKTIAVEMNLLLAKIDTSGVGYSREISLCKTKMEEAYLWFACAVDKFGDPEEKKD